MCHKPLYSRNRSLERYGHSRGPIIDPLFSAAHFFVCVPLLPYSMGVEPPHECIYSLGYYRSGDCAPWIVDGFPISLRGLALNAWRPPERRPHSVGRRHRLVVQRSHLACAGRGERSADKQADRHARVIRFERN